MCHDKNGMGEEGNRKLSQSFHFPRNISELSLASATLEFKYAMEFYENTIGEDGNGKPPHKIHFPRKNSEPFLRFQLRSKSSMRSSSVLPVFAAVLLRCCAY